MPFFGGSGGDYHIIATNIQGGTSAFAAGTGSNNMALGNGSLEFSSTGNDNISIGNNALNLLTTGSRNVSIGYLSLWQTLANNDNVFIGMGKSFAYPLGPGPARGEQIANIDSSVCLGNLSFSTAGNRPDNGHSISQSVGLGHDTISIGSAAPVALSNIVAIGSGAGTFSTDTSGVICIGQGSTGATNSIAIGNLVSAATNSIVIGDASHTSVIVGGITLSSTTGSVFPNLIAGNPGTEGAGIDIGGVTYNSVFKASDIGGANIAQSILHRHSTTWEAIQVNARSNSDTSAHGAVTNGMLISSQYSAGWTGTEYNLFGRASFQASATGTISDTSSPGDYVIATTPDGATLPVEAVRVKSDKSTAFGGGISLSSKTFATLPAASGSNTGQIYFVSDVGISGSHWVSNGTQWKPLNGSVVLASSAVKVSHTGDLLEFTFATIPIAGGIMGANGRIEIEASFSNTNNANTKTQRIRFGGDFIYQLAASGISAASTLLYVQNRNNTNSQVATAPDTIASTGLGTSGTNFIVLAKDTTITQNITFTGQLSNAADTVSLESYRVILIR